MNKKEWKFYMFKNKSGPLHPLEDPYICPSEVARMSNWDLYQK